MSRQLASASAYDARGVVGPARQRVDSTGAPDSSVKSVCAWPTGKCSGRSRLVHRVSIASWRRLERYGPSLGSTSAMKTSLPT